MANAWFYIPAVLIGIAAFVLFVLSVAVAEVWLPDSLLGNISQASFAVYGVIASGSAIGLYVLSKED